MAGDMEFLRSDTIRRLLDFLQIQEQELVGIVFDAPVETGVSPSQHVTSLSQHMALRPSPGVTAPTDSPARRVPSEVGPDQEPLMKGGLEGSAVFGDESRVNDVEGVAMVVLEEEMLQRALLLERKALMSRGAFIPLMRFELENYSTSTLQPEAKQYTKK